MNRALLYLGILALLVGANQVIDADPPPSQASITVFVHLQACGPSQVAITSGPSVDINGIACGSSGEVHAQVEAEASCGETVTYLWEDDAGGSFDDATSATPVWTAPYHPGPDPLVCTLTVTASASGATPAQGSVQVTVDPCPDRIYVDLANTSGGEDGLTWATAFNTLQEGADAAVISGLLNVWVKAGIYNEPRSSVLWGVDSGSLLVPAGVSLFGGFDGTETQIDQRDWVANPTVIDGFTSRGGQPSYHVVFAIATIAIDGFTIRGGDAHAAPLGAFNVHNIGGGVLVFAGDATLLNTIFEDNSADFGGAVAVASGNVVLDNSAFTGNGATTGAGGIFCYDSTMTVNATDFTDNTGNYAGAAEMWLNAQTFDDCTFTNNSGVNSGAVFAWGSAPIFNDCSFNANQATLGGGAAFHFQANSEFNRCTMDMNEGVYGGAMSNWYAIPSLTNCLITNSTGDYGGAMTNVNSFPTILNCTIADSFATTSGGALYDVDSIPTITNSILWNDAPDEIAESGPGVAIVTYTTIQGGRSGVGNLATDPLFVPGGYELDVGSPCVDSANTGVAPPDDLLGVTRPQGAGADRGAFESH